MRDWIATKQMFLIRRFNYYLLVITYYLPSGAINKFPESS